MQPRLNAKNKRRLAILGACALVIGLFLILLPIGLRWGAVKWLDGQGVQARIEDIDLNLFTGRLAITGARGENAQGKGFRIALARANVDYWPLISKQIYLSNLELRDSRVDVRVDESGNLSVAGVAIAPGAEQPEPEEPGTPWGFGLERAAIGALTLGYEQPDFSREITLSSSSTSDLATWEPDEAFPLNAALTIGKSDIILDGSLKPFGDRISGDMNIAVDNFALELIAPLARAGGVEQLAGVVNSKLEIKLDYQADTGLQLTADGDASLAGASVNTPTLRLVNADVEWQGSIKARLLQRDGENDQIDTDGHFSVAKLDMTVPASLTLQQADADWQGRLTATLGEQTRVDMEGELKLDQTQLAVLEPTASPTPAQSPANSPEPETTPAPASDENQGASAASEPTGTTRNLPEDTDRETMQPEADTPAAQATGKRLLTLDQGALQWQGKLSAVTGESLSVKTDGVLTTDATDLALPGAGIKLLQQALQWQGTADYKQAESALVHASGRLQADGLDLNLAQQAMTITGARLAFDGQVALDPAAEGVPANAELPLRLTGKLSGGGVQVDDTALDKTLAEVDEFTVEDIQVRGLDDIRSTSANVRGIAALARQPSAPRLEDFPYIATIGDISVERLALSNQSRLQLGTVTVSGIDALLYRGAQQSGWEAANWFGPANSSQSNTGAKQSPPASAAQAESEAEPARESDFEIALERGQVKDSALTIDDRGVSPSFETRLSNLRIALADLDSTQPAQASALDISSALGRYGSIKAQGTIKPFLEPPSANVTGKINAVNLAPISGYTVQAIDRRIDQGTFSADLKLDLNRGDIDANAQLTLTKLRIGGAQTASGVVENKLGLPLNKILSLLRNGDGDIVLNLPVGGNLQNPQFSILDIVQTAILKSLQKAVLLIYSPIKLGKGLINLATALNMDPVLYQPGQAQLDDSDQTYLDKIAKRLRERPETELILCGHAVPADRSALQLPSAGAPVAEGQTEDETGPSKEELGAARDTLLALANTRTSQVGDYLVTQGIASGRLVLCNPALGEAEDALPRTSMSF